MTLLSLRPEKIFAIFPTRFFKYIFLNDVFILISLKFVPQVSIVDRSALVQIIAWRLGYNKPLPEQMLNKISYDRLIFNMGIPILWKDGLYIETGTWCFLYAVYYIDVYSLFSQIQSKVNIESREKKIYQRSDGSYTFRSMKALIVIYQCWFSVAGLCYSLDLY